MTGFLIRVCRRTMGFSGAGPRSECQEAPSVRKIAAPHVRSFEMASSGRTSLIGLAGTDVDRPRVMLQLDQAAAARRSAAVSRRTAFWARRPRPTSASPAAPDDYVAYRVDAVDLKNRLRDVETDRRDPLHAALPRIVVTPSATTSVALTCRWRSRPQHHNRTLAAPALGDGTGGT
jgi:hypothetical protein